MIPVSVGNTKTLLIDTPGFDDPKRKDGEILTEIAQILSAQYELGVKLKGIIYIHRITDVRYSGASVKTYEIFKKMCGETALSNVSLITSRWGEIDQTLGADRERELKAKIWAYMLGKGSNVSRFHGDRASAIGLVVRMHELGTCDAYTDLITFRFAEPASMQRTCSTPATKRVGRRRKEIK